jgi:V/A-type H+-transporting ATPase subunit D
MREQLEFVKRGRELLEMKRDHLASEINKLLEKLKQRESLDKKVLELYEKLTSVYSSQGYLSVASQAAAVTGLKIAVKPISIMGVVVPEIRIEKKPDFSSISNLSTYDVAEKFNIILEQLLEMAILEAQIEVLAKELMMTNRKVNALNKVLIPGIMESIKYIEGKLEEEMLEEFSRAKILKKVLRRVD